MRLSEAMKLGGAAPGKRRRSLQLLTGFLPLHLETFVKAYAALRFPDDAIQIQTGLFGDLEGNIHRASIGADVEGVYAAIEWSDFDQRLGFRSSAGWSASSLSDILLQAEAKSKRLEQGIKALAKKQRVVVSAPTVPYPPITHLPPARASQFELRLNTLAAEFLQRLAEEETVAIVSDAALARVSPSSDRHNVKLDLIAGFPYTITHADRLAALAIDALFPAAPKKGVITDLDQTLWKGILGDLGPEGVSWSLDGKSQHFALYQQLLGSLAESGILLAIVSKNDPAAVDSALARADLLVAPDRFFPIAAGWGPKSEAVARVVKAWNIGPDSIVFVDDSPMELAEVAEKFPDVLCLPFPHDEPAGVLALLLQIRQLFGKTAIGEEDRFRLSSLRNAATLQSEGEQENPHNFIASLNATITIEPAREDPRAFELVNKTNQFNLNGVRYTESEWKALQTRLGSFLLIVSYTDRFGPLGRIAVIAGCCRDDECLIDAWVLSCRAFSRHIEHQIARQIFAGSGASSLRLAYRQTERNGPTRTFLSQFISPEALDAGPVTLSATAFDEHCPPLSHNVESKWKVGT